MQEYQMNRRKFFEQLGIIVPTSVAAGIGIAAGLHYLLNDKKPEDYNLEFVPVRVGTYGEGNATVLSIVKAQHLPKDVDIRDWVIHTIDENRRRNPKFDTNLHSNEVFYVPKLKKDIKPSTIKELGIDKSSSRKE